MIYKATTIKEPNGSVYTIKLINNEYGYPDIAWCCDEMQEAWKGGFVGFGEEDPWINRCEFCAIYVCHPYPEGACWEHMPIHVCPFCGEQIVGTFTELVKESQCE